MKGMVGISPLKSDYYNQKQPKHILYLEFYHPISRTQSVPTRVYWPTNIFEYKLRLLRFKEHVPEQ